VTSSVVEAQARVVGWRLSKATGRDFEASPHCFELDPKALLDHRGEHLFHGQAATAAGRGCLLQPLSVQMGWETPRMRPALHSRLLVEQVDGITGKTPLQSCSLELTVLTRALGERSSARHFFDWLKYVSVMKREPVLSLRVS